LKLYVAENAKVSKIEKNGKYYNQFTFNIGMDYAYKLLEYGTPYVFGKEIAPTNALAIMRVIKQVTKYKVLVEVTLDEKTNEVDKIVMRVQGDGFPELYVYLNKYKINVVIDKNNMKKINNLKRYVPVSRRKTYKSKSKKYNHDRRNNK
jgi:hypothetical protein